MLRSRFLLIAGVSVLIFTASCSKSYTCHCTYATDGSVDHEEDSSVNEGKKQKSEAKCNEMDNTTTYEVGGTTFVSTTECELVD